MLGKVTDYQNIMIKGKSKTEKLNNYLNNMIK